MSRRILLINPPVLAVDAFQVALYAEAIPFGLLQIGAALKQRGNSVRFLDMMEYWDGGFEGLLRPQNLWGQKTVGDRNSATVRNVYLYGKTLDWLGERLKQMQVPDEILVTCCISFNYEPAHAVIRFCRQFFPRALIRLGGFYSSIYPEHAARAGADEVHIGPYPGADGVFPQPDLLQDAPRVWLFRLVRGCRYRCSYCINALHGTEVVSDPVQVADEIVRIHATSGVGTVSNWDPNVMLRPEALDRFLDAMIERGSPVQLKFEMGIQPDLLTPAMADKMLRAGVKYMTVAFESAEAEMMKRFGKPYRIRHAMDAVAMCRDLGFDTRRFHCTSVIGIRGESYRHIFRTYFAILKSGGLPTPFPLSPSPGTREYEHHAEHLRDKDLDALNGHLWPTLASGDEVHFYDLAFEIINQPDPNRAAQLARRLPAQALAAFERELAWYHQGPHCPGNPVDE